LNRFVPTSLTLRFALGLIVALPLTAAAQLQTIVRVRVVDTAGVAVANADVSALHGLNTVVAGGPSDSAGRRTFAIPRDGGEYQLVARRIGFQRGDQFFAASRDTVSLRIVLRATPRALPAVNITEKEDVKRRAYHIDADQIASSNRNIIDGLDILTKLRPDIIYSRVPGCAARYVWVNGKRIVYPPIDQALAIAQSQRRRAQSILKHTPPSGLVTVNLTVQSVMASIHPEHIAELTFADCNDQTVDVVKGNSAIFVALKPGIAFEPGIGSYVVASAEARSNDTAPAARDVDMAPKDLSFRARLVGVFDESNGEPVVGAEVADSASGTFARTTTTGTVSLSFLPEGASTLRIHKPGFVDLFLAVSISPRDTLPLTLLLTHVK
jgi:carboxypeptidase family protein